MASEKKKRVRTPKQVKTIRVNTKTIKQVDYLSRKLRGQSKTDLDFTNTIIQAVQVLHDQFRDGYQLQMPG